MALTEDFEGTTLPAEWTWHAPAPDETASFTVSDSRVHITVPTGIARDGIFNTTSSTDLSAGVVHELPDHGGDIDIAIQCDTDVTDLTNAAITLMVYVPGGTPEPASAFRSSWYKNATATNWQCHVFSYARHAGSGAALGNTSIQTYMSGHPAFMRVSYAVATGTWTVRHSSDGWNWITRYTGDRAFTATHFKVGVGTGSATPTFTARINQVIDLIARGNDDLRDIPVATRERVTVTEINGTDGVLPANWIDDSYGAAGLSWTGTHLRLSDPGDLVTRAAGSARLRWLGAKHVEFGLLIKAVNTTATSSCFFVPGFSFATTEDTWNDQYTIAGGYGQEIQSGGIRRTIRLDDPRDGNVSMDPESSSTGLDETPYTWLTNLSAQGSWNVTPHWWRFEYIATANGHRRFRVREWVDGDPEPETWGVYDGQDETNDVPLAPAFSLARNALTDSLCQVDIEHLEFYQLTAPSGGGSGMGKRTVAGALNEIAGATGLTEVGAANALAGTTGLTLAGALNALAGTTGLTETGAANALAGTTGLTLTAALNTYLGSL